MNDQCLISIICLNEQLTGLIMGLPTLFNKKCEYVRGRCDRHAAAGKTRAL